MTETEATLLAAIIGGTIGIAGTYIGASRIIRIQEFYRAASKFRATILYELTSFYPINQGWDKKQFTRLYDSIPRINAATAEFRYFVVRKATFDKAVSEYNKYCRENTGGNVFILDFPSTDGKSRKDYMVEFKNIVDHLLSFADKR